MLSSRLVLPERYGPHSATTRCAPLPGLPPVMVSDLMSAMTTSSCWRGLLRTKAQEVVATELGRSEVLSWKSFHPGVGESMRGRGKILLLVRCERVAKERHLGQPPASAGITRRRMTFRRTATSQRKIAVVDEIAE